MSRLVRRAAFASGALLVACGPLLGLDDLRPRTGTTDAGDGGDAGDAPSCTSNAQCFDLAQESIGLCVDRRCVKVDRELCETNVFPSRETLTRDDLLLVAAFVPRQQGLAAPVPLAYKMAVSEISKAGPVGSNPTRTLAMIFCDSDPANVAASVKHVMQDLHVPAVIANFEGGDLKSAVEVAKQTGTFILNPSTVPTKYGNSDELLWNLLGTAEDVALAYPPLVRRLEAMNGAIKVALVSSDGALEQAMADVVDQGPLKPPGSDRDPGQGLLLGDAAVRDSSNAARYLKVPLRRIPGSTDFDVASAVDALATFRPDVVLLLTSDEHDEAARLVAGYENDGGGPKPIWLLGPRNAETLVPYVQTDAGLEKRFAGIQYAGPSDPAQQTLWRERIRASELASHYEELKSLENQYDAVYWITYGMVAAGPGKATTGASLAAGVRRMIKEGKPPVSPGGIDVIDNAYRQLGVGEARFVGALGPPDIEEAFGTWRSVGAQYCYRRNQNLVTLDYDVFRYGPDAATEATPCNIGGL